MQAKSDSGSMNAFFSNVFKWALVAVNVLCVAWMLVCAYSSYLPPQTYPNWSYVGLLFPFAAFSNICFIVLWLFVSWKRTLISVAGFLLCAWAVRAYWPVNIPGGTPDGALKVMSYNVMQFGRGSGHKWQDNQVVENIRNSGADIVCLQEVGSLERAMWRGDTSLDEYPYIKVETYAGNNMGCLSKYPILSAHRIEYESPANCSRAYEILVGEDTVLVINNHLESYRLSAEDKSQYKDMIKHIDNEENSQAYTSLTDKLVRANKLRGPQVDSVANYIDSVKDKYRHIILCGDFNDSPVSYAHHRLTKYLNDAYTRAGNGPGFSYHRHGMLFRLDHMLVSDDITVHDTYVDRDVEASDHYPIVCTMSLK